MRKNKIFIALLFIIISSYGQDSNVFKKIDSLKILLKNERIDTSTVNIINQISDKYNSVNHPNALIYVKKSFEIATKINYKKGLIDSYRIFGKYYYNRYDAQNALIFYNKIQTSLL